MSMLTLAEQIDDLDERITCLINNGGWETNRNKERYIERLTAKKMGLERDLEHLRTVVGQEFQEMGQVTEYKV